MSEEQVSPFAAENRKFGLELITRMETNMGIQIRDLFESEKSAQEIRAEMHQRIVQYVQDRLENEQPSEEWPNAGKERDARKALGLTSVINVVPNVSLLESNYKLAKNYEGQELNDFVRRISNGLSLIQEGQTAGQVAGEIIGSGLAAFALAMIIGTVKALRAGNAFRQALVLGVRAMGGVSVVVGVAALIVTEILLYLLVYNKKQFLGLVMNNTDLNLVVDDWRAGTGGADKGDLFVSTGSISSFMEQHETEQFNSPLIQIGARQIIAPNDPDNIILGGFFFGEKNFGLFGTEGAMVFHDRLTAQPRFGLLFACPYAMDNGVNVTVDTHTRSAKNIFEALYGSRGLYKTATNAGFTFSARTAWKTGGETMGLASLDQN